MKLNLDKAKEILELLQEDTLTPKQAKELVTLLFQLTEKQKQDLISKNDDFLSKVSQETFTLIHNALIEIREKAHDNQLEVRQLTNKQKIAHESKMAQLEALIDEFRAFEIPELDEERLTKDILSKIPEQEEYELLGENVVNSINSLDVTTDKQIDAKHIKNLPSVKQFIGGSSNATHTGDATGSEALTVVKIQGTPIPAPVAGDDQKVIKYNHGTMAFIYDTVSGGSGLTQPQIMARLSIGF